LQFRRIAVARRSETKAALLKRWLEEHRPEQVRDAEFAAIRDALAPVSERYLRELLRGSGYPLDPLVEGVLQDDFQHLERTLRALQEIYLGGERQRSRAAVIAAKDHARFALKRLAADPTRAALKEEMLLWLMTWLENPPLFADWVEIRKRQIPAMPEHPGALQH